MSAGPRKAVNPLRMKKFSFLVPLILFLAAGIKPAAAQVHEGAPVTYQTNGQAASPAVFKDPRLNLLVQKQVYLNMLALRHVPGYRVQVISTIDRAKATATRARLMELFPDYQSYLSYQSPYFRVRIGDFRDQNRARQLQEELNNYFPNGVFTVRDYIQLSPEQLFRNNNDDDSTN